MAQNPAQEIRFKTHKPLGELVEYLDVQVRSEFRSDFYKTTPSKFSIKLPPAIRNAKKAMLLDASIPNAFPNICNWNNTFTVMEEKDSKQLHITVPAGYYATNTLTSVLKGLLDTESKANGNGYTYTVIGPQQPQYKFLIQTSANFNISYSSANSTLAYYLGYRPSSSDERGTAMALQQIPNHIVDIRGSTTCYIFTNLASHTIDEWGNKNYLLGSVNISPGFLSMSTYVNTVDDGFKISGQDLECLDIELKDQYDETLPIDAEWQMTIRFTVPWGTIKST